MSKNIEDTLKLAFEALDFSTSPSPCVEELQDDAIAAIKEALMSLQDGAQPAVAEQHKQLSVRTSVDSEQQEPVGVVALIDGKKVGVVYDYSVNIDADLYTTPPQRTAAEGEDTKAWVGLTDEEIDELHGSPMNLEHSGALKWVRIIEAKLKEKNERLEKNT